MKSAINLPRRMTLAEVQEAMPIGSRYGWWEVAEAPFSGGSGLGFQVKVRCTFVRAQALGPCGLTSITSARRLLGGAGVACKGCGRWKGEFYPRPPWSYREHCVERQHGVCAWPPCGKSLHEADDVTVDHNRACCPDKFTCGRCVRGAVHSLCNTRDIFACDFAVGLGAVFPKAIQEYLARGR